MKIKNIAFSGFMAAIMLSTGAAMAAPQIASKAYVDNKATTAIKSALEDEDGVIKTALAAKADTDTVETLAAAVNDTTTGLAATKAIADAAKKQAEQNKTTISTLSTTVDTKASSSDVYTKTEANSTFATQTALSEGLAKKQDTLKAGTGIKIATDGTISTDGIATDSALSALETTVDKHTTQLSTLTGDENTAGSVAKSIADAVASTKTAYEAADTTTLQSAKAYADGLADNYATAAQGAKADTALQKTGTLTAGNLLTTDANGNIVDAGKKGALAALDTVDKSNLSTSVQASLDKADSALQSTDLADYAKTSDMSSTYATITDVNAIKNTADDNKMAIDTLKGSGDGSVTKAVSDAKSALETEIAKKADKATTLAGYGITDAMTETEIKGYAIPKPGAICTADSGRCVLSVDKTGNLYWVDVTKPIDDETSSS